MAAKKSAESSPLTFDLKADLISVLDKYQTKLGGVSKSEIIRHAISQFDYATFKPVVEPHRQISVRLPLKQKNSLVKLAKGKKVSIGELLRAALESLPGNPASSGIEKPAPKKPAPKKAAKKVVKKAAKKAAKKPAAKKAAKKAAPKKAVKKAAPKKVVKKAAPKKVVKKAAKKAAPKKAAPKKAAPKKAAPKKAAPKKVAKKAVKKTAKKKK
ncbi:CopG family transcriptional regulator [Puniceicoccaceae bacterium K14]|nr:CopG family transcriptional regulator [Puniceicoccaceae bacterium K14]